MDMNPDKVAACMSKSPPPAVAAYVQLVESYRDHAGKVKKRTVATLGRLDQVDSQLHAVIQGLIKVSGQVLASMPVLASPPSIAFESTRSITVCPTGYGRMQRSISWR